MISKDIRPFIPARDFESSKSFYEALGFTSDDASDEMSLISNGVCTFFLYKNVSASCEKNLMFQLLVPNIKQALKTIENIGNHDVKYEPVKEERWGKVIYMWGPSGEMWHITELHS